MELKLKGNWEYVGNLADILPILGNDYVKQFSWKIFIEETNVESKIIKYNQEVDVTADELLKLSKEDIQFIDGKFSAYKENQLIFTLLSFDSSYWLLKSENKSTLDFFKKKFNK
jgi:hypothetical protein